VARATADAGVQRAERDASPLRLSQSHRPNALVLHRRRHDLDSVDSAHRSALPGRSSTAGARFSGLSRAVHRAVALAGSANCSRG